VFILHAAYALSKRYRRNYLPSRCRGVIPESGVTAPKRTSWAGEKVERNEVVLRKPPANGVKRPRPTPKRVTGSYVDRILKTERSPASKIRPLIFFFSLTESTRKFAWAFAKTLRGDGRRLLDAQVHDLAVIDLEDFFEHLPPPVEHDGCIDYFYIILVPSYNVDTALDSLICLLQEIHNDFRIGTAPLSRIAGYTVFGFGDRDGWTSEEDGYCAQAIETDRWMAKLTAGKRAYPIGLGDVKSDAESAFAVWKIGVSKAMEDISENCGLGDGVPGSGEALESDIDEAQDSDEDGSNAVGKTKSYIRGLKSDFEDLEDLGGRGGVQRADFSDQNPSASPLAIDFTTYPSYSQPSQSHTPKEMVPISSATHTALTKQGYTIIGSHSGVKICRWTKSALRGRGSCYKYSFYGIKSHLCMETTPSLSCSNKCVFCWRHGTNPVGTTWRWQVDPPDMIFNGAKEGHYKKIKMMRGVPGVRAERFQEAMQIRHCALSLVGEPIFYPHINAFVALLHKDRISSFLVCNAQHPDQLAALKPVTQLYVSIDASNKESLRKIDRPLHRDYWQRFLRCLDILEGKRFRMRTVFRLTLVKGFNIDSEVEGYAALVARGLPCFVEIKGVTYCGTSSSAGAGLTMQNVPFYGEIVTFVEALNAALERKGLDYGIAAEHAHSCCVLIASRRFFVKGRWHTLIDYEKFFERLESGTEFSPEDYMGPETPQWATWGQGGFDPTDQRVDRKGRPKMVDEIRES